MTPAPPDLAALLGSRICHDLISPLGAIGNGVELLAMGGTGTGPELTLISDSVDNATARIRLFRIAFGAAAWDAAVAGSELRTLMADLSRAGRVTVDWRVAGDPSRPRAKLACLLIMCLDASMPRGGTITVDTTPRGWRAEARAEGLRPDPALWALLADPSAVAELTAADIQFPLAAAQAAQMGVTLRSELSDTLLRISF